MISLTGLRTFVAVVETGGIRPAAHRLNRTPSAVSMTLKQLEADIGGALFLAERKAALSQLGYRVLDEAQALLAHYERSCAALRAFAANQVGRCDVASVPSVATTFLPAAIARLRTDAPDLQVSLRDMDSAAVIDAVDNGRVEIGFCVLNQPRQGIAFTPLLRETLELVCRADHPLARQGGAVAWPALTGETFIVNGSMAGLSPPHAATTLEARNVASILAMIRAGLGVSILPRLCRPADAEIAFLPLADAACARTLGWIARADRKLQPAAARLVAAVADVIGEEQAAFGYELAR
ncbi:LysR family transcriptional regulator [Ancylobacter sp. 6x-1]|uniref:LysR family transcriptional regulator n=1 Tax=Ancylobacter crimeensis TaxID=2579147 RepID=A0ABT0D8G6_9HYPH|nr:LysR family transcriptional regulator [Ancylobacter crimeensis]MCK0196240.1 LysR family transcriptional regulator [Ancylobacter crimeensis]